MSRSSVQAQAAIAAMHRAHPRGRQTANQLRAERANLAVARASMAQSKAQVTGAIVSAGAPSLAGAPNATSLSVKASIKSGRKAALTVRSSTTFRNKGSKTALGVHKAAAHLGLPHAPSTRLKQKGFTLPPHKITGIIRRVPKDIAPSGSLTTTSWRQGRHMRHHPHRLVTRKRRRPMIRSWRAHRGASRPR